MLIDCPYCDVTVDAREQGEVTRDYGGPPEYITTLLECPRCGEPILAGQELVLISFNEMDQSIPRRLWPSPQLHISSALPLLVSRSLEEAEKCYNGKAYLACAVMCGRVIEAICKDNQTKDSNIAGGLKELLQRQIIDNRIFQWAEALRIHRNIGAHASNQDITKEDAKDLLDFTLAICDYVYHLTQKFQSFMSRKESKERSTPSDDTVGEA